MSRPNAAHTARERARAELTREIKEEARRQLAEVGADALSLRAVARSLGMVSSALYRYFPSRDDLLTSLIIDAYNALGDAVEAAASTVAAADGRARWVAVCRAARCWALANPHEYALIYGSPVPGYRAPQATIAPAARLPLAFLRVLRDAAAAGGLAASSHDAAPRHDAAPGAEVRDPAPAGRPVVPSLARSLDPALGPSLGGPLAGQAAALAAVLDEPGAPRLPPDALVRAVIAWTQLFGMVSFELFGQFVGSFEPADAFFEHAVAQMAAFVGLR
jgi:AcrR family transcriptional regulator